MAAKSRRPSREMTVEEYLFLEPFAFDFFQAMRLLERLQPQALPVTRAPSPHQEPVRLRVKQSLEFPASSIHDLQPPTEAIPVPALVVAFLGMTGSSGVLPRHYTELLMGQERYSRHAEKYALRDWLDMFNHRFISLFYRAWEKYRFFIAHERGECDQPEPDTFTHLLFSLIGLGMPSLRERLRVSFQPAPKQEQVLARVEDLGLLRFGGFLAHRPRNAVSLRVLLTEYFRVPVEVMQFQGQWLRLEPDGQSSLGKLGLNNSMGVNALVGDRIWDVQSKIRIRLGPLTYAQFVQFLPDTAPVPERKALFLLAHVVRLYVGLEIDIEVQLMLKAGEVPMCRMGKGQAPLGARIGWNTWSHRKPMPADAGDPVFPVRERVFLPARKGTPSPG